MIIGSALDEADGIPRCFTVDPGEWLDSGKAARWCHRHRGGGVTNEFLAPRCTAGALPLHNRHAICILRNQENPADVDFHARVRMGNDRCSSAGMKRHGGVTRERMGLIDDRDPDDVDGLCDARYVCRARNMGDRQIRGAARAVGAVDRDGPRDMEGA